MDTDLNPTEEVAVVLSTYNGEKYLRELIESVLNQINVKVRLFIRDDGSTDNTIDVINSFGDSRITLYKGTNMGPAKSFLELLRSIPDFRYYAFCDQDDVWCEDKLFAAVSQLKQSDGPALYLCCLDVVDENLQFLYKRDNNFDRPYTLAQSCVFRSVPGCVQVFNHSLREFIDRAVSEHVRMHDMWVMLVAEAFHVRIYTDFDSHIMYRLHGTNTVGLESSYFTKLKRLFSGMIRKKNERLKQAKEFYDIYGELLPDDSKEILLELISYKSCIRNRYKVLKDERFRWDASINRLFFISILLGLF